MRKTIAISGGFDPVHIGHLHMIKDASKHGSLIVILNSDAWLEQKKGYVFMTFKERKAILEEFKSVHHVVEVDDSDGTTLLDEKESIDVPRRGDRIDGPREGRLDLDRFERDPFTLTRFHLVTSVCQEIE